MSTGVAGGGDGTVTVVTTTGTGAEEHQVANTSTGSAGASGAGNKTGQLTLTPRFTQEEKEILYSLFHEHEEVIDIKFRKKQRSKYSVRDAWENIVREFNSHPGVSAVRNLKQIQKFWLNARLRKQYPFRPNGQKEANNTQTSIETNEQSEVVNHPIKDEPDFQLTNAEQEDPGSQNETFEEIDMDTSDGQLEQEHIDPLHQQQQQQQQQQQHQHHQVLQHHVQQQQQNIQTQQISVDQISAEKLTLNDLLQFKTTRPREDIILQIKHPTDSTTAHITIPSPTRITIPSQHQTQQHTITAMPAAAYNQQIISEIKPQQITLAQYQAQQLQQQQLAQHQLAVAAQQHQQQQQQQQQQHHQVKMQLQSPATAQFATATPTFTCTTLHALPVATAPAPAPVVPTVTVSNAAAASAPQGNTTISVESFEEKVQYFRLKEAELRFKEVQVSLEKKKMELNRAQEELKHLREVHRLQVEELKMKIRILQEEEKILRKSPSAV
ncbi:PREDICTED: regulatory protein zeste [Rhagoletis zephyria]|uniref:regulatory protein zeste n=1 Tax=Rhagoletis zephyria TaxID=28612 RepID=UPI0008116010|nr:PREDICTED: regulatory protein zeste [Rhagoletis zephyria]